MRVKVLLRRPAYTLYTVACGFHERPAWTVESSCRMELVVAA
jgi:hypothetical protein